MKCVDERNMKGEEAEERRKDAGRGRKRSEGRQSAEETRTEGW